MLINRRVLGVSLIVAAAGMSGAHVLWAQAQSPSSTTLLAEIDRRIAESQPRLIEWRRHLHQHPELSNREVETAKFVAETLRSFGLEPQVDVARHGVVATLKGGVPGPVVALRADMDGLPVREEAPVPFASQAKGEYEGNPVSVMHACGHDTHMAMLLATAKVLSEVKDRLPGSVKFIFQPAEEGAPRGETPAGAQAMVQAGVLKAPDVDAVFGLHVFSNIPTGHLTYRRGPFMAASDQFEIVVRGRQTHGATPWRGIDPIVVASQIVVSLQTVVSRGVDITAQPAIVTVGQFQAGVRNNIIPDSARLVGTIRTFDEKMQNEIHQQVARIAQGVASAAGTTAEVAITRGYPVTINHPDLTDRMVPTLERVAPGKVKQSELITGAEDFSYFQREVPGVFVFLGITPPDQVGKAPQNHSPLFQVDEAALPTGVRALAHLTVDYMAGAGAGIKR
jgi:amidohydrolase